MLIAVLMFFLACMICAALTQKKSPWKLIIAYWFLAAFKNAIDMMGVKS